ncbi:hypothetical protein VNO78_04953 [Psophocarpus tetragonolobus]|uniref:COP9 signalosome complex subunit 4 n=1 Tax=Psophocarpus tetragonolobus TaxID=3891 RepID=A0AAN9SQE4_PSOTE
MNLRSNGQKHLKCLVVIDDAFRLSKCVQIACLYLEVCYARILDLKRKFLEAALRNSTLPCSCHFVQGDASLIKQYTYFEVLFAMLYLERILRKPEIDAFAEELKLHQAVCLSCSFDELGTLLGIQPHKAKKIVSRMIYEDRMRGSIDQVEVVIHFDEDTEELQRRDQQCEIMSASEKGKHEANGGVDRDEIEEEESKRIDSAKTIINII